MADLSLAWDNDNGAGDLCVVGADLLADDGLATAVLISLFSDRRVREEELPPGASSRRGWWGDRLAEDNDQIGSKLWLLRREKTSPQVLVRAEGYCREALAWMLTDGVATAVAVAVEYTRRGWMLMRVTITLPDDTRREFQFSNAGAG